MATEMSTPRRRSNRLRLAGRYTLLAVVAAIVMFPIYATVMSALKSGEDSIDHPQSLLPIRLTIDTLRAAWSQGNMDRLLFNSIFVSVVVTVGVVVTSVMAAYAFTFIEFRGRRIAFGLCLATLLVPVEATVVVNQRTIDSLGWKNSYQGLIIPLIATAFGIFLVRQVFMTVPKDLREAAALDGVGHIGMMRELAVPLARPTLGALALFTFLGTWNQYLWPQAVVDDVDHRTIQIGLDALRSSDINRLNLVTAGTVIGALPIFIMLVFFQRQLVRGLTAGAIKG